MEELLTELKSKRISGVGIPEDYALIQAWMHEIRTFNPTRRIYRINPYIEVYEFRKNVFSLFTQNCDGAGDVWMHLIVGPEKAMLIDTAFGLGDIKGLCDLLSGGKELIVVNTHPHPDHGYGNCRFDKVYCHEFAADTLRKQDEHLWDYLFDENGNNRWLVFDREDLPVFKPYEIVPCKDGTVFDLGGGHEVELKWVPGHHSAHCMFLDKKNRILFAGDGICAHVSGEGSGMRPNDPYGKYNNLECYRAELRKLYERLDEFDAVFPCHFILDLPAKPLLEAMLEACDAILDEDKIDFEEPYITGGGEAVIRQYKYVKGFGILGVQKQNDGIRYRR